MEGQKTARILTNSMNCWKCEMRKIYSHNLVIYVKYNLILSIQFWVSERKMSSEDTPAVGTVGGSLLEPGVETDCVELLLAHFARLRGKGSETFNIRHWVNQSDWKKGVTCWKGGEQPCRHSTPPLQRIFSPDSFSTRQFHSPGKTTPAPD